MEKQASVERHLDVVDVVSEVVDEVVDLGDARPVSPVFLAVVQVVDDRRQPVSDARRHVLLTCVDAL